MLAQLHSSHEKAMATHSSTLAWKIPWTDEPGRLQSMGSLGVRQREIDNNSWRGITTEKYPGVEKSFGDIIFK